MTDRIKTKHWIIAYAVIGLLTFSYEASDPANCWRNSDGELSCTQGMIDGYGAGLLWPVYWPWSIAEFVRGPEAYEAVQ